MRKVVIKISQGSVVTQTVLCGLTIYLPVANFVCFISTKNYEHCLRVDKVIAMNAVCSFFGPPCILHRQLNPVSSLFVGLLHRVDCSIDS